MVPKRSQSEDRRIHEGSEKKPKVGTKHPLPDELLHLSALQWSGNPTLVAPGDIVEYGKYIQVLENAALSPVAWSDEHDAFVYRPPLGQPITFMYRRAAYLPDVPDDDFAVAGGPQEQDPLLLLHRPSATNAFQASLMPPPHAGGHGLNFYALPVTVVGPPFVHWPEQMVNISPTVPSRAGILSLEMPDLEVHRAELANSGPPESWSNSGQWEWWSGDWARNFIQQGQTGQPLPPLDKPTVWSLFIRKTMLSSMLSPRPGWRRIGRKAWSRTAFRPLLMRSLFPHSSFEDPE